MGVHARTNKGNPIWAVSALPATGRETHLVLYGKTKTWSEGLEADLRHDYPEAFAAAEATAKRHSAT